MGRGNTNLDSTEYDDFLVEKAKRGGHFGKGAEREIRQRNDEKRNKGYKGWHFGIDGKPIYCKDKSEFKEALDKRGLMMKDDVRRRLK